MNDREHFKTRTKNAGGGTNIKLEAGESVYGVFLGDPKVYYLAYDKATKQATEYSEPYGDANERFKWNLAVKEGDQWKVRIYNGPIGFGKAVDENIERFGQETLFEIKREGTGMKTRWHIFYVKDQPSKEEMEEIKKLETFDLKKFLQEPGVQQTNVPPHTDEDIPF